MRCSRIPRTSECLEPILGIMDIAWVIFQEQGIFGCASKFERENNLIKWVQLPGTCIEYGV